jgi:hypothetical protein
VSPRLNPLNTVALLVSLALSSSVYADVHQHRHEHMSAQPGGQVGKKLATDDVLKAGMDNIRQAMLARQPDVDAGRLGAQDYQRLAAELEQHLAKIVKNCKLSKETDRAFHSVVLADLTRDLALMRTSPKVEVQRVSAAGVMQTLRHYGDYFEHPGWTLEATPVKQP